MTLGSVGIKKAGAGPRDADASQVCFFFFLIIFCTNTYLQLHRLCTTPPKDTTVTNTEGDTWAGARDADVSQALGSTTTTTSSHRRQGSWLGPRMRAGAGACDTDTLQAPGTLFFSFFSYYKGTNNYLYIAKTIDHVPVGRNASKGDMREAT